MEFYTRNREKTVAEDTRWWYEFVAKLQVVCAMRVLLVDDDVTVGRGLSLTLKPSGAIADLAETGEEALELLRHYDYDLVILRSHASGHGRLRGRPPDAGRP